MITSLLIVMLASCHSTKQAARTEREATNTTSIERHNFTADDRQQLWHTLELQLDSFELWLPAADDTLQCITSDKPTIVPPSLSSNATGRGVLLKAKRATLSNTATAAHTSSKNMQLVDSMRLQVEVAHDMQEASDRVAVTKPPDISWYIIGFIVGTVAALGLYLWFKRKQ